MVIMDAYYSSDRLQDIWQTIDHLHLSYLEMEESPEKLDHRERLENCIRDFLCMASHSQKFVLQETSDVLYRSASMKRDFSGYKAATGWNAIQLYAGNLLSQPWRKEYRQIKMYCGFFKHQIEANLDGAEIMFEIMGYKLCGNEVLLLDGPICPDRVTTVSRDCLIAYVECQILKAIWEEITPAFKISWLEVLEFRKNHLCSPEQSIRALNYQFHEKQYQAQQNSDLYSRCHPAVSSSQYPQMAAHSHVVPPPPQPVPYLYGTNNCCPNNYATYAHVPYAVPVQYPQHVIKPSNYSNGYYCANGYLAQQPVAYGYTVPTGQLIELDPHQNGGYDMVDRPTNSLRMTKNSLNNRDIKKTNETKIVNTQHKDPDRPESHFEDWDYVYRNLESQGYSKDLGERGDILSPPVGQKKSKATNLDDAMHNLAVTDRPLKIMEALEKYEDEPNNRKPIEQKQSDSSSYENLSEVKKSVVKVDKRKSLPIREKVFVNNIHESKAAESPKGAVKWECKSCTYHNDHDKDICEICSKSRVNVEQQMEIGGPQCSKCTLVNAKDMKVCQACGASLKDSPTYI